MLLYGKLTALGMECHNGGVYLADLDEESSTL